MDDTNRKLQLEIRVLELQITLLEYEVNKIPKKRTRTMTKKAVDALVVARHSKKKKKQENQSNKKEYEKSVMII